jgi:hypothetical protein
MPPRSVAPTSPSPSILRAPFAVGVSAGLVAFSWWATELHPFTATAYLVIGATIAAIALAAFAVDRPRQDSHLEGAPLGAHAVTPWIALAVAAVVLEAAGLELGGRSRTVPTLSTVIDHALVTHVARFALFVGWLAIGLVPILRAILGRPTP